MNAREHALLAEAGATYKHCPCRPHLRLLFATAEACANAAQERVKAGGSQVENDPRLWTCWHCERQEPGECRGCGKVVGGL